MGKPWHWLAHCGSELALEFVTTRRVLSVCVIRPMLGNASGMNSYAFSDGCPDTVHNSQRAATATTRWNDDQQAVD